MRCRTRSTLGTSTALPTCTLKGAAQATDTSARSTPGPRSVIEYGPFRDAEGGDSAKDAVTSLGRGKAARQHVRVRLAHPHAGDESPRSPREGDALRVPFHPLSSTVSDVMEVRLASHARNGHELTRSLVSRSGGCPAGARSIAR
jgi:hypothetical protein